MTRQFGIANTPKARTKTQEVQRLQEVRFPLCIIADEKYLACGQIDRLIFEIAVPIDPDLKKRQRSLNLHRHDDVKIVALGTGAQRDRTVRLRKGQRYTFALHHLQRIGKIRAVECKRHLRAGVLYGDILPCNADIVLFAA